MVFLWIPWLFSTKWFSIDFPLHKTACDQPEKPGNFPGIRGTRRAFWVMPPILSTVSDSRPGLKDQHSSKFMVSVNHIDGV